MLRFIAKMSECKTSEMMMSLYISMERLRLEYVAQFWSPNYRRDHELLEKIQRRVTKMIPHLRAQPCEEQCKRLNLFSLGNTRLREDLSHVFKHFKV